MNVAVFGALGNMGRRYQAILKHLGHTPHVLDLPKDEEKTRAALLQCEHVIAATPTFIHLATLREICALKPGEPRYVLMEKPISTRIEDVKGMYRMAEKAGVTLYSVNQYQFLPEVDILPRKEGGSWYDYFHHGADGLHWDCFQIYALARGEVKLDEKSPKWNCGLNGISIKPGTMDGAYVEMIKDFLGEKKRMWGQDVVVKTTERILAL